MQHSATLPLPLQVPPTWWKRPQSWGCEALESSRETPELWWGCQRTSWTEPATCPSLGPIYLASAPLNQEQMNKLLLKQCSVSSKTHKTQAVNQDKMSRCNCWLYGNLLFKFRQLNLDWSTPGYTEMLELPICSSIKVCFLMLSYLHLRIYHQPLSTGRLLQCSAFYYQS